MGNLRLIPRATTGAISEADWRVQHLRGWDLVAQPFPALSQDENEGAIVALEAALKPVPPDDLAAALEATLVLWRAPNGGSETAEFYIEALEEFPPEIVAKALKHVRLNHRYASPPTPADFHKAALEAAAPLRGALVRARIAAKRFEAAAERSARWSTREPVLIGAGTYKPRTRAVPRERTDGTGEINLGSVDQRLQQWLKNA